jgi:hypothetical protein
MSKYKQIKDAAMRARESKTVDDFLDQFSLDILGRQTLDPRLKKALTIVRSVLSEHDGVGYFTERNINGMVEFKLIGVPVKHVLIAQYVPSRDVVKLNSTNEYPNGQYVLDHRNTNDAFEIFEFTINFATRAV